MTATDFVSKAPYSGSHFAGNIGGMVAWFPLNNKLFQAWAAVAVQPVIKDLEDSK